MADFDEDLTGIGRVSVDVLDNTSSSWRAGSVIPVSPTLITSKFEMYLIQTLGG